MFADVFFNVSFSVFITFDRVVNVSLWSLTWDWSSRNCMFWSSLASSEDWMLESSGLVAPAFADDEEALADAPGFELEDAPLAGDDDVTEWPLPSAFVFERTCSLNEVEALRSGAGRFVAGRTGVVAE